MRRFPLLSSLAALTLAVSGAGATPATRPAALSAADQAVVADATAYLQDLKSARAHFIQFDARGGTSQGEFWLQRPGKARFAYAPPSGLTIASNGLVVSVLDSRLNTFQSYLLSTTPLALFLSKQIRFDRGVEVIKVSPTSEGFSILAQDAHRRNGGQIALYFTRAPLALVGWTVTDAQGAATRVRLIGLTPTAPVDAKLFSLKPPKAPASAEP
jgi:outer membrane lipoprotein-sorting protein